MADSSEDESDEFTKMRDEYDFSNEEPGTGVSVIQTHPKVVTLCGSTRFYETFQKANFRETMAGHNLSVGFYPHTKSAHEYIEHGEHVGITANEKAALDDLHKRKIDMSDEVFVLNVGGYIGDSTRSEIEHAEKVGVPVRYLEPLTSGFS